MHNKHLEISFELRWQQHFSIRLNCAVATIHLILVHHMLIIIELSLLHNDFEGRELILSDVDAGRWHVLVYYLREQSDISMSVDFNSLYKAYLLS